MQLANLSALIPMDAAVSVELNNGTTELIKVVPFGVRKLAKVGPHLSGAYLLFKALAPMLEPGGEADITLAAELMSVGGEPLFQVLAEAAGKPVEWLDNVSPDSAVLLAITVVKVNADFFGKAWQRLSLLKADAKA